MQFSSPLGLAAGKKTRKVAKAQYNAHLLAGLPGDPVETTLAYLRKRRFAT